MSDRRYVIRDTRDGDYLAVTRLDAAAGHSSGATSYIDRAFRFDSLKAARAVLRNMNHTGHPDTGPSWGPCEIVAVDGTGAKLAGEIETSYVLKNVGGVHVHCRGQYVSKHGYYCRALSGAQRYATKKAALDAANLVERPFKITRFVPAA